MSEVELTNPFKLCREAIHLSVAELAEHLGVTRNFITRAENGEYPRAPRNLLEYYGGGDYENILGLDARYTAYQTESRKNAYGLLIDSMEWFSPIAYKEHHITVHPFTFWLQVTAATDGVKILTIYEFCKEFCVQQSVMHRWLTQPKTVKRVPKEVLAALFESGYDEGVLIDLEQAYESYRREILL